VDCPLARGDSVHGGEFLLGGDKGRLEAFDFAEPAVFAGFVDAFDQIAARPRPSRPDMPDR
jgi:hypothetical protein